MADFVVGQVKIGTATSSADSFQVAERIFNSDYYKRMSDSEKVTFAKMVAGRRELNRDALNKQQSDVYGSLDSYKARHYSIPTTEDPIRGQRLDSNRWFE